MNAPITVARRERPAAALERVRQQAPHPEKRFARKRAGSGRPSVALVRAPIVSTSNAVNNEATPGLAYAYISAYIARHGYACTVVDGIAEALGRVWPLEGRPGYQCQGLTFDEILNRIPADVEVIGSLCTKTAGRCFSPFTTQNESDRSFSGRCSKMLASRRSSSVGWSSARTLGRSKRVGRFPRPSHLGRTSRHLR